MTINRLVTDHAQAPLWICPQALGAPQKLAGKLRFPAIFLVTMRELEHYPLKISAADCGQRGEAAGAWCGSPTANKLSWFETKTVQSKPECDDDCSIGLAPNYIPEGVCKGIACPIFSRFAESASGKSPATLATRCLALRFSVTCTPKRSSGDLQIPRPGCAETGPAYHSTWPRH